MTEQQPDVALDAASGIELVLAFRDGDGLHELATADAGRLELYRGPEATRHV